MCDTAKFVGKGWQGWMDLPPARATQATGNWIDLTFGVSERTPRIAGFPAPKVERVRALPEHPINVSSLSMVVHTGTHVDSPRHFYLDGPAFQDIPLERLMGPGVVWRLDKQPGEAITAADLATQRPAALAGDIVAIACGWDAHDGTDTYGLHPYLTLDAADWLVAQRVKLVAIDFSTPDLPVSMRPAGFDWPVHKILLRRGVLIAEHLRGFDPLAGRRAEFMFAPLPIDDCDGAPARVMARAL